MTGLSKCRHLLSFAHHKSRTVCFKIPEIPECFMETGIRRIVTVPKEIDTAELFQKAMGKVPQQVVVVTSAEYNQETQAWHKRGVTCSSFTSVSFSPPIVSFCLNTKSRMHDLIQRTKQFAVHVLGQDQIKYGIHFSTLSTENSCQFDTVQHIQGEEGLPIILGSLAVLTCGAHSVHTLGDHHVWYGNVLGASLSETHQDPLLYFTKSISDEIFLKAFEDATLPFEDWTHEAHIRMAWNYIREYGRDGAIPHVKLGIQKFNQQNITKIKVGYHETITIFFLHAVSAAMTTCPSSDFQEFLQQSQHLVDNSLIFQYYSKDRIFQDEARHKFITPDKKPLPS